MFHSNKKCLSTQKTAIEGLSRLHSELEELRAKKNLVKDENGLFPCPFCGRKASIKFDSGYGMYYLWMVNCSSNLFECPVKITAFASMDKELAIEKWNTRA